MLTTTLRNLERDGFVTRTAFATIPPRVDYELTDLGRELLVPVTALGDGRARTSYRINAARAKFDSMHAWNPGIAGRAAPCSSDAAPAAARSNISVASP